MRFGPPVGFARRPDGRRIAYQVLGEAELDLVYVLGFATHLGLLWEDPSLSGFLHKLATFSRLILLDRLGSGLSDRGRSGQSFEDDMDDVRLVLDTVGSERTAFFGGDLGGRLALLFAATYPERTRAVVAFAAHPATVRDQDYPWGPAPRNASSSWPPCGTVPMTQAGCWPGWPPMSWPIRRFGSGGGCTTCRPSPPQRPTTR
jgi:pimeloyl-ACP methyl ester carboxylesterase